MNDYQFVASTVDGEKKTSFLGVCAFFAPAAVLLILLKGIFPTLITNQALLWLVVVVPSFICFSATIRFLQKHYVGVFTIRMKGKHVTLIRPDCSVMDLGQITKATLSHSVDYKRADLLLIGTKDEALLRLRSAATWNGKSSAKDFSTVDKAVVDMNAAMAQQPAA